MYSNKIASTAVQGQYLSSGKKLRGAAPYSQRSFIKNKQ